MQVLMMLFNDIKSEKVKIYIWIIFNWQIKLELRQRGWLPNGLDLSAI